MSQTRSILTITQTKAIHDLLIDIIVHNDEKTNLDLPIKKVRDVIAKHKNDGGKFRIMGVEFENPSQLNILEVFDEERDNIIPKLIKKDMTISKEVTTAKEVFLARKNTTKADTKSLSDAHMTAPSSFDEERLTAVYNYIARIIESNDLEKALKHFIETIPQWMNPQPVMGVFGSTMQIVNPGITLSGVKFTPDNATEMYSMAKHARIGFPEWQKDQLAKKDAEKKAATQIFYYDHECTKKVENYYDTSYKLEHLDTAKLTKENDPCLFQRRGNAMGCDDFKFDVEEKEYKNIGYRNSQEKECVTLFQQAKHPTKPEVALTLSVKFTQDTKLKISKPLPYKKYPYVNYCTDNYYKLLLSDDRNDYIKFQIHTSGDNLRKPNELESLLLDAGITQHLSNLNPHDQDQLKATGLDSLFIIDDEL